MLTQFLESGCFAILHFQNQMWLKMKKSINACYLIPEDLI